MKISIDADLCTGHARCAALAPELFTDDDRGYGIVIGSGDVAAEFVEQANRAVAACPERAITLSTGEQP